MARLAVVSGGGTGIGRATAGMLAGEGYDVIIIGRRPDVLADAVKWIGPQASAVTADLVDPAQVAAVAEAVAGRPVDVLVNNAGAFVTGDDTTPAGVAAQWRATFDSNVITAVLLTDALRPLLRRPGGRVILTSSIAAQRGGGDAYGAAKAGLVGWALDLAKTGGPDGITVNLVSPGYVQDTEFFNDSGRSKRHDQLVAETLLGRAGTPADIAGVVHFLASEDASWITGQVIGVNGGALLGR